MLDDDCNPFCSWGLDVLLDVGGSGGTCVGGCGRACGGVAVVMVVVVVGKGVGVGRITCRGMICDLVEGCILNLVKSNSGKSWLASAVGIVGGGGSSCWIISVIYTSLSIVDCSQEAVSATFVLFALCHRGDLSFHGDRYLKPWIIPEPEVTVVPRAREDECLVLASDGLWDVMSNDEVCDAARKRILLWHKKHGKGTSPPSTQRGEGADPAAQAAADYLSRLALQKGSKDNITVIVIDLKAQRKFKTKTSSTS